MKDVSVMPYMIGRRIAVTAKNLKPQTRLYPFFDKQAVSQYCGPAEFSPNLLNVDGTIDNAKVIAQSNLSDPSSILHQTGALNDPLITSSTGTISLVFYLPANTFRAGERVFTLVDQSDINAIDAILTSAEGTYHSSSLSTTKQNLSYSIIEPVFTPTTVSKPNTPLTWDVNNPPPVVINNYINNNNNNNDTGGHGGDHGDNSGTNPTIDSSTSKSA